MKKRLTQGLILAVMLLIPAFFLAGAEWNLTGNESDYPNQLVSGDLNQLVRERLPFTRQLEQLGLDLWLLGGQREQNNIFISEEGLMRNIDAPVETLVSRNNTAIGRFANMLEEQGGRQKLYVAIVPTAVGVLQQDLPRFAESEILDQQRLIEEVYNSLPQSVRTVDVYTALYNRRDQYLYYRTDSGLTSLGGYYAYTAMARLMELNSRPLSQFNIEYAQNGYYGDLYQPPSGVTGEWSGSTAPYRKVQPDVISLYNYNGKREYTVKQRDLKGERVYHTLYPRHCVELGVATDIYLGGQAAVSVINSSVSSRSRLLVFGDRTALAYLPFLASHYGEIVLVDLYYAQRSDLEQLELEDYNQILIAYGIESYIHTGNPSRVREVSWQSAE